MRVVLCRLLYYNIKYRVLRLMCIYIYYIGTVCMVYTILLNYASRTACRNPEISRRGWLDVFFVSFQPFRRGMCTEQTLLRVGVHYYVDDRRTSFMKLYIYNIHIRVYTETQVRAGLCVNIILYRRDVAIILSPTAYQRSQSSHRCV